MQEPTVIHSTFVIERSYSKPIELVFSAFSDPAKKRRWFGDGATHDVEIFEMDFRVGGRERTSYRMNAKTPFPGVTLANDGTYHDIVPNRRVVLASSMSLGDRRISTALVTIELIPTDQGADLICTHQGAFFEGSDGPQMREAGWKRLFDKLTAMLSD